MTNIQTEHQSMVVLKKIEETYNALAKEVNENPQATINASGYCRDVQFLLSLIHYLFVGMDAKMEKDDKPSRSDTS